jgi:Anp1
MSEGEDVGTLRAEIVKLRERYESTIKKLFAGDFIDSHNISIRRKLMTEDNSSLPTVLIAILAKQKEKSLPLYLECIDRLDFPKSLISLYIRTNSNKDRTEDIIRSWLKRIEGQYRSVEFDSSDIDEPVENFKVHEWNLARFKVLSKIRNVSLQKTIEHGCDFYFVCDVDNFIVPWTLVELVRLRLPIVAPLMRNFIENSFNSNFFESVDDNGYYKENNPVYLPILTRAIRGVIETQLVHHTYLIRKDVIPELSYDDGSGRYEFVVFSDSARRAKIPQYIDNRQIYGYITTGDEFGYRPGDEEDAIKDGALKLGQVDVTRQKLEVVWALLESQDEEKTARAVGV